MDYEIECIAMAIVNYTNEINEVPVDIRQKNNDKCFDFAVEKIKEIVNKKNSIEKRNMVKEGICPHCNKEMKDETREDGFATVFFWECGCGRSFDTNTGKDITDYECTDIS